MKCVKLGYDKKCKTALCITGLVFSLGLSGCATVRDSGGSQEPSIVPMPQEPSDFQDAQAPQETVTKQPEEAIEPAEQFQYKWDMSIIEEEVYLDGFSGELDVLFLTDSHAVIPCDDPDHAEYSIRRYQDFLSKEGMASSRLLHDWITYANMEKVDIVLFGGDIIDHPSGENMSYLDKELCRLEMPYLYAIGNHDWTFPWEYMTETGKETYLPPFELYMQENVAIHTWEAEEIRIIAVDNSSGQVNPEAMEPYRALLKTGKPVVLLLHVPFSTETLSPEARKVWDTSVVMGIREGDIEPDKYTEEFLEATARKDSPVELILAGHVHFYHKDCVDGEKKIIQIVGDAAFHGSAVRLKIRGAGKAQAGAGR